MLEPGHFDCEGQGLRRQRLWWNWWWFLRSLLNGPNGENPPKTQIKKNYKSYLVKAAFSNLIELHISPVFV